MEGGEVEGRGAGGEEGEVDEGAALAVGGAADDEGVDAVLGAGAVEADDDLGVGGGGVGAHLDGDAAAGDVDEADELDDEVVILPPAEPGPSFAAEMAGEAAAFSGRVESGVDGGDGLVWLGHGSGLPETLDVQARRPVPREA